MRWDVSTGSALFLAVQNTNCKTLLQNMKTSYCHRKDGGVAAAIPTRTTAVLLLIMPFFLSKPVHSLTEISWPLAGSMVMVVRAWLRCFFGLLLLYSYRGTSSYYMITGKKVAGRYVVCTI